MGRMPFATIIVPTYNQASYLGPALESLLAQTEVDWEAIVVNDGSTDTTAEIAEDYGRRDSRIRCIHKPNGGVASALNAGLEKARGEWIHWLSSDDMFEPQKLAINRSWIVQHPDTNFFFSYFTLLTEATGSSERRELWGPLPDPQHQILTLFYRNYVSGISICVRRSAWEAVGFFDESLHYAQDYGQWLRLLQENQGLFIPEWTVINRNHAAQGSERFPDACYFDTAKAALRFINRHPFQQLVPWVNLSDSESATKAVSYALEVACDRTAFLYCLGPNPALILRVLEWAFSEQCALPELRILIRSRIAVMSFTEGNDDWAWMWRQLAVLVHGNRDSIFYAPTDTTQLALREYRSRKVRGGLPHEPLRSYLTRFESIDPDEIPLLGVGGSRVVFLIDSKTQNNDLLMVAARLASRGYRPLGLIADEATVAPAWQWFGGIATIRVATFDQDTLPWLGEVALVVTSIGHVLPVWLDYLAHVQLEDEVNFEAAEQKILAALGHGPQQQIRPVVFLERVLWGGGAERVVFDIARHLDRRRYRPIILTMCDEHTVAPDFLADVEFCNVRHQVSSPAPKVVTCEPPAPKVITREQVLDVRGTGSTDKFIRMLRRVYHRVLIPDIRKRIRLGHSLLALKKWRDGNVRREPHEVSSCVQQAEVPSSEIDAPALDFDFINAMAHHNPAAVGLARIISKAGRNAVLVSVMEEAAVTAWLAQAQVRFPYVISLHTFESKCLPDIYQCPSRFLAEKWLLSVACRDAEAVTLPSWGCCRDLEDNFAVQQANILKVWNPVDCARVRRLSFQRMAAVECWLEKAPCFRMVHVGRLDKQKNHELLLAMCAELKVRQRAFSVAIVGEGYDRPNIEKRIDALGLGDYVDLVGEQKNPFPWMAAADALVLTSRFESFALVLVEAMVCGTPVVSVDCPTGPAEVLSQGECGLLVPNDDPLALADAVERLMDDSSLMQDMTVAGYARAQEFDVKKIVPQWEALIDDLPYGQG